MRESNCKGNFLKIPASLDFTAFPDFHTCVCFVPFVPLAKNQ
jgi:hypothetical protein|nr:MAG TPA: hypothetical protein [Caudoviricetes sp.]